MLMKVKRTTIQDIADKTGYSKTAVSFAFNSPSRISKEAVEAILKAAEELDYIPDPMARNFSLGKHMSLGFLLPQRVEYTLMNPYMQEVIRGIAEVCQEHGYMLTLIPPSVQKESWDKTIAYLDTDEGRVAFASEIMKESSWDNMVQSIGWDRVLLSSVSSAEYRCFLGKDFSEIARLSGKSESDIFIDILKAEDGKAGVIVRSMAESDVDKVASLDFSALISDSLYSGSESPHPRLYGSFPRFIADFSLRRKILPIEKAIWKMTGLTAERYGLSDRGLIKNGYKADIVIFSPDEIMDNATYTEPLQFPSGIRKVLINGEVVMENNRMIKNDEGHLLRFWR